MIIVISILLYFIVGIIIIAIARAFSNGKHLNDIGDIGMSVLFWPVFTFILLALLVGTVTEWISGKMKGK